MNAKMERMSNSENFRARITETELRIEKYGSRRFGGQNGLFRRFSGYLRNFELLESFDAKEQGLL
jgi:hypothetical protein